MPAALLKDTQTSTVLTARNVQNSEVSKSDAVCSLPSIHSQAVEEVLFTGEVLAPHWHSQTAS